MKHYLKLLFLAPVVLTVSGCNWPDPDEVTFSLAKVGENVSFHTEMQDKFFADNNYEDITQYGSGDVENTRPLPIKLSWDVEKSKKYTVNVSENEDMSNAWTFETSSKEFDLYNCKTGTKYYWTVTAEYPSHTFTSEVESFSTKAGGVRNIYVDGLNNIRDIGGYTLNNGKTIKQGLIYRCAKLNESSVDTIQRTISDAGVDTMINQLGIKTDVDLRKNADLDGSNEVGGLTDKSPLGDSVKYVQTPMYYNGSLVLKGTKASETTVNQASIKKFFDLLADESSYPLAFHCTQGKDRTGQIAYLLETFLGMDQDERTHDYLFTNMSCMGGGALKATTVANNYAGTNSIFAKYNSEDLQDGARQYLLGIGVTQENLDKITTILTK